MKLIKLFTCTLISIMLATSCEGKINAENAMEYINKLPEYQTAFFAPINIGKVVISAEGNKDADNEVYKRFQKLIDAGMVEVKKDSENVWRSAFNVTLTDKAKDICDPRRTCDEVAYLPVCTMKPTKLISALENTDTTLLCQFVIQQKNITVFGEYLDFDQDVEHQMSHEFVK